MEDKSNLLESLLEKATDYGKTSFELVKLKTIEKTADVVSTIIPHSVVFTLVISFLLFINLGLAFWLGDIFGKLFYGFFAVAAFYLLSALFIHFFLHKQLKKRIADYLIIQILK